MPSLLPSWKKEGKNTMALICWCVLIPNNVRKDLLVSMEGRGMDDSDGVEDSCKYSLLATFPPSCLLSPSLYI